jgi:hypothetical protein
MSYSFSFRAATKAEAHTKVTSELDQYLTPQPQHRERQQAEVTAHAFIDLLEDDDAMDIMFSMNGSVGWKYGAVAPEPLNNVQTSIAAYHVPKVTA